jgi:transcription antitermination factor NusG
VLLHRVGHTILSDRAKLTYIVEAGLERHHIMQIQPIAKTARLPDLPVVDSGFHTVDSSLSPPEWYAVQTRPRHEKRVAEELRARAIEEFLPLHRCRNRWRNGVVADVELPLFPCYLFVRVPLREKLRLLQLPGVIGFAVNSARPTALAQEDIEALRILSVICRAEPHPFLKVGDRVRIIGGPLTDMEGILLRRKQELRVVLSLDFILRSVAVEVSELDIEPISERRSQQRGFRRTP